MNKRIITILMISATLLACSSLDFFQYRENTGLYVVEKPYGYGTVKFGARIAASGDESKDFMAVSAGAGSCTLFYDLAEDGTLLDVKDYKENIPGGATDFVSGEAIQKLSGADLAGLPLFAYKGAPVKGCLAIGEPAVSDVVFWCASEKKELKLSGDTDISNFGQFLAAIRTGDGTPFLLAVGGSNGFRVYADINKPANTSSNRVALGDPDRSAVVLAGGRLGPNAPSRLFVAVGAAPTDPESDAYQMILFVQNSADPKIFDKAICLENTDADGFGGALTTGDLDGDGADELVVGTAPGQPAFDSRVRIYDVHALITAQNDDKPCFDIAADDVPTLAVLEPELGDLDVDCIDDCAFGSTLAVGDIATDDDGPELIIGAPRAKVEGVSNAGAAYIFRGWGRSTGGSTDAFNAVELAGHVFDSTPEGGKEFGAAVAAAPMAGRNELLISATGEGKVFVAYCTGVGEDINEGGDVPKDADGKVVSTRCRL